MAPEKYFIWGGSYDAGQRAAHELVSKEEIAKDHVLIVTSRLQLIGYRGGELWLVDGYKTSELTTDIVTMARSREMTIVNKTEDGVDVKEVAKVGAMTMERKDGNINGT